MVRPEDSPLYLMVFSVTSYSGLVFPVDTRAFTYFYCQVSDDEEDKLMKVNFVKVSFPLDSVWRTTTRSTSTTATGTAGGRRW